MTTSTLDPVLSPPPVAVVAPAVAPSPAKAAVKRALHGLATVLVSPWLVCYWLSAALLGRDRALEGASQSLALLPGVSGMLLRRAFLARVLARCHPSAEVCFGTLFSQAGARIDENVYVGPRCHLGLVHLEQDVLVAAGVQIPSGGQTHYADDPSRPIRAQGGERRVVRVGAGSWIGSAAVILADVGRGTIVGAGSVVTKPLPDFVIAAGVPARVIRPRFAQGTGTYDEGAST
jgi:acetyltransferase-like isoleucine patch superfamily enzyme